jgi:LPXTG-motif cell wall-anchored protein
MHLGMASSAIGSAAFTAAVLPSTGSTWQDLMWSVISAVLASTLSWLAGRKQ